MSEPRAAVIGDLDIARRTCAALVSAGYRVDHLTAPSEQELRDVFATQVQTAAVVVRGDLNALRYALLIEHLQPGIRLVVTLFDRTVAQQIVRVVPNCAVTSPADVAVPSLAGALLDTDVLAVGDSAGKTVSVLRRGAEGAPTPTAMRTHRPLIRRIADMLRSQARPHDMTTRILLAGLVGLTVLLGTDWALSALVLGEPTDRAFYTATSVVATVGSAHLDGRLPSWYLIFGAVSMLLTIGLTAIFTAAVVTRMHSSRSIGLIGRRTVPTRGHYIVVGLGQVGLRLCLRLRQLGLPVVAVERDPRAANLRLARQAKIPVLIAHGEDRAVLDQLRLTHAKGLAAVGADDLDNVEIVIASLAVAPGTPVVIRAGEGDVITETRSLFPIGRVCDVSALTARAVLLSMLGAQWQIIYETEHQVGEWPANACSPDARRERLLTATTPCQCA